MLGWVPCFIFLVTTALLPTVCAQDPFGSAFGVASGSGSYSAPPGTAPPMGQVDPVGEPTDPAAPGSGAASGAPVGKTKFGVAGRARARSTARTPTWQLWWGMNGEHWLRSRSLTRQHGLAGSVDAAFSALPRFEPIGQSRARREIVPFLLQQLNAESPAMRASTVIALGRICTHKDSAVQSRVRLMLTDPQLDVRAACLLALGFIGSEATLPELMAVALDAPFGRMLLHQNREIPNQLRSVACIALGMVCARSGSPLATSATQMLLRIAAGNEPSGDLRGSAILALALYSPHSAVPRLIALAGDTELEQSLRAHALTTLGRIGDPAAIKPVVAALQDERGLVVAAAATALGFLCKPDDDTSLAALRAVAEGNGDRLAVSAAILALGECGPADTREFLMQLLQADAPFTSAHAALALGVHCKRLPHAATASALTAAWNRCSNLQEKGAFGVALAMAKAPDAARLLEAELSARSVDRELAAFLSTALGMLGDRRSALALLPWISQTRDLHMRVRATQGALMLHSEEAVPLLIQLLPASRSSQGSFTATVHALGLSSDARALPPLIQGAVDESGTLPELSRAAAVAALGILADKDHDSLLLGLRRGALYGATGGALSALLRVQ